MKKFTIAIHVGAGPDSEFKSNSNAGSETE
jgi:hypothetical protein